MPFINSIHLHGFKPSHTHRGLRRFVRDNYTVTIMGDFIPEQQPTWLEFHLRYKQGKESYFAQYHCKGSPLLLDNLECNQIVKALREQVHALSEKIALDNNDKVIIS